MSDQTNGSQDPESKPKKRQIYKGKQAITREKYLRLVDAFREFGDVYSKVAAICGVAHATAKRAYERGWPSLRGKQWAQPIKLVLEQEEMAARAAREQARQTKLAEEEKLAEQARADAIRTRTGEAEASRITLDNARVAAAMNSSLIRIMHPFLKEMEKRSKDPAKMADLTMKQLTDHLTKMYYMGNKCAETVEKALQIERLRVGDPTAHIAFSLEDMSLEDAQAEAQSLVRALDMAKKNLDQSDEEDEQPPIQ